ncbi:hypothetical protein ACPYIV_13120 [Parabacteroides sp. ASD2025]|uniref:hypothetical protein n=1 Tax=Parabacteroides sp. ASD2025 TaxID=3415987 RepID=UPI003CEB2148
MNADNLRILYEIDKKLQSRLSHMLLEYFYKGGLLKDLPLDLWRQHFAPAFKWEIHEELRVKLDQADQEKQNDEQYKETADKVRDFRINCMTINNFRKFPKLDIPFGLKLSSQDKDDPESLILLGKNGVGKSSLFASFEYIFEGIISEARLRNYEVEEFATHSDAEADASSHEIRIFTREGVFTSFADFKKSIGDLNVNPFFCSEWDIISIGQRKAEGGHEQEAAFHDFFAENLGFGELIDLKKTLADWQKELAGLINMSHGVDLKTQRDNLEELDRQIAEEKNCLAQLRKVNAKSNIKIANFKRDAKEWLDKEMRLRVNKKRVDELPLMTENEEEQRLVTACMDEYVEDLREVRERVSRLLERLSQVTLVPVDTYLEMLKMYKRSLDNLWNEMTKDDKLSPAALLQAFTDLDKYMNNRYLDEYLVGCSQFIKEILSKLDSLAAEKVKNYSPERFEELSSLIIQHEKLRVEIEEAAKSNLENVVALHDALEAYRSQLEKALDATTRDVFSIIRQTVKRVMSHFVYSPIDKEDIDLLYTEGGKISVQIRYDECADDKSGSRKEPVLTPRKYYNTFRYKLFCMMLKLSVALAVMKRYRINFPIILDDVFYASDYYNRELITSFVKELNVLFRRIWGNSKMKMQLICFTHDELVFDAIETAFEKENQKSNVIFGRLLDYKRVMENKSEKQNCIDPEGYGFSNLYLKLFDEEGD